MSILHLSDAHTTYLLHICRRILSIHAGWASPDLIADPGNWMQDGLHFVNVTYRTRGKLRGSMSGSGDCLPQAVEAAAQAAVRDRRYAPPDWDWEFDSTAIELWIQRTRRLLSFREVSNIESIFSRGVHGMEVTSESNYAYYKPSVPLTSGIADSSALLTKLCEKARLPGDAWKNHCVQVHISEWEHYAQCLATESEIKRYLRLRPIEDLTVTRDVIQRSASLAALRLATTQDGLGRFAYEYKPFHDQVDNSKYNLVRHAGCAYALAWMSEIAADPQLARLCDWAARNALRHLADKSTNTAGSLGVHVQDTIRAPGVVGGKLGASALTLLALQYGSGRTRMRTYRNALVDTVLSSQRVDGSFRSYIGGEDSSDANQDFFPGEALVALVHEYTHSENPEIRKAVSRAFPYYLAHFKRTPATAFVLWQSDAWRLWHLLQCGDSPSQFSEFVFYQIDWLLQFQHTPQNSSTEEYHGGFSYPGTPKFSSATFTEAVIRALGLAHRLGDAERVRKYRIASLLGLRFLLRLQIQEPSKWLFPKQSFCVGGITQSLESFNIRCDYDQHAITALLASLENAELICDYAKTDLLRAP